MKAPIIGSERHHESAWQHVSGEAIYVDDITAPIGTKHVAFATSQYAKGTINAIHLEDARNVEGVVDILLAEDITYNLIGPVIKDTPLLAQNDVSFYGQALCAILAKSEEQAQLAAKLIRADITSHTPIVTPLDAKNASSFLREPIVMQSGSAESAIKNAPENLKGTFTIGGQEHFYLESQAALAIPLEDKQMLVHSSTQNPTEVQHLVAHILGVAQHSVEIVNRRMGGAFGGKETDSSQLACICALFAKRNNCAVKARLPRNEDFKLTGKRHDFHVEYDVGFDDDGRILGVKIDYYARCGYALDLSFAIVSRTLFHSDNCYYLPNAHFTGHLCKTNTASNTAFRGFGAPQSMLAIENIIENIAQILSKDALEIRRINYYGKQSPQNLTHYGQVIEDNIISELTEELINDTDYAMRRLAIDAFNKENKYLRKGLALSPVKFGISFTTTFLNQAGALVHIYHDGSIYVNHGGTEMGQGLYTKVAQIVAEVFGVTLDAIKVSAASTAKVPNTSATAASSGSDLNGMATYNACMKIKNNLIHFAKEHFAVQLEEIIFQESSVYIGNKQFSFHEFIHLAYTNRVELFSNGFYKTPKIHFDVATSKGSPFYYYAYGVALSEVVLDCLTGEYKLLAVDILHDVGSSLNPAIDMGQIVGGFIQGMGWLTTEELQWDSDGRLTTTGPATYKIPSIGDTPKHFNVNIRPNNSNFENTIYKSKAVGEPPFMLAISVWLAIKNALFNATGSSQNLCAPATFEACWKTLNNIDILDR